MSTILDTAVERHALSGHDGRTGATLERVVLADGTNLVVKRTSAQNDLVTRLMGQSGHTPGDCGAAGCCATSRPGWTQRSSMPGRNQVAGWL